MILKPIIKRIPLPPERTFLINDTVYDPMVQLVARQLITYVIENPGKTITYGDLVKLCNNKVNPHFGLNNILYKIVELCKINHLPLISAVVCNKRTKLPGTGFWQEFYSHIPEKEWPAKLEECLFEIADCDEWEDFLDIFST